MSRRARILLVVCGLVPCAALLLGPHLRGAEPVHAAPREGYVPRAPAAATAPTRPTTPSRTLRPDDEPRDLLAAAERRLGRVTPEIEALAARVRLGESDDELRAFVAGPMGAPLAVRLVALEWIDARAGRAAPTPWLGAGGGRRRVAGLSRR